jgi:hypothetical protein
MISRLCADKDTYYAKWLMVYKPPYTSVKSGSLGRRPPTFSWRNAPAIYMTTSVFRLCFTSSTHTSMDCYFCLRLKNYFFQISPVLPYVYDCKIVRITIQLWFLLLTTAGLKIGATQAGGWGGTLSGACLRQGRRTVFLTTQNVQQTDIKFPLNRPAACHHSIEPFFPTEATMGSTPQQEFLGYKK